MTAANIAFADTPKRLDLSDIGLRNFGCHNWNESVQAQQKKP